MDKYIEIGKISNTHGINGEVRAQSWGDDIYSLMEFDYAYIGKDKIRLNIEKSRPHKNIVIIKFEGVDDLNKAEKLKNNILYMNRTEMAELPQGSYYLADLIGLEAVYDDGTPIGIITEVIKTGANDVFVIKGDKQYLVPFIESCVKSIDMNNRKAVITPIEGLFDDEI